MIIRQIEGRQWNYINNQITDYGKSTPLSLQYDIDINCNGVDYILKVQPAKKHKIAILQVLKISSSRENSDMKSCQLIETETLLSSLFEIILYQGAAKA